MKKLFLLTLLMAGGMMGVEAQNRSIGFEQTREWKKVIKKAKKEKKRLEHDRINEVSEENSSQAY